MICKRLMELGGRTFSRCVNLAPYGFYRGHAPSNKEIRQNLSKWGGGSIDLKCDNESGIATLVLNQPEKRNAISGKMMGDLEDALDILENWQNGKGLVICGNGGHFCSGGDLDLARGTGTSQQAFATCTYMNSLLERLNNLPIITVAIIDGAGALGGGAELIVACDFRLILSDCRGIGFVHGKMGILPAWGATVPRLYHIIGYQHTLQMLATAQVFLPKDCLAFGLVNKIVSSRESALDWVREMTSLSVEVTRGAKITVSCAADASKESNEQIMRMFAPFWGCKENQRALEARIKHR